MTSTWSIAKGYLLGRLLILVGRVVIVGVCLLAIHYCF